MKESFLHFIWQFQQYDSQRLETTNDESLKIYTTGIHNTNAGPDFLNAKVQINGMTWHGQIEIHISSSSWYSHNHHNDPAYNNVILHVVWEDDHPVERQDGYQIPTLELKGRIENELLRKSNQLVNSPQQIPCSNQLDRLSPVVIMSAQQQAAIHRLKDKSRFVLDLLEKNEMNWEETTYQLMGKNFGFKINSETFMQLTKRIPLNVLKRHSGSIIQIESLLIGLSGYLDQEPTDEYQAALMNEYEFLAKKYSLLGEELHRTNWKLLRLRPGNFPLVRISQFAALINTNPQLFDALTNYESLKDLISILSVKTSDYWQLNYAFGKISKRRPKGIGKQSVENVLINTSVPLLAAYSQYVDEQKYMDKAVEILESLKPENNHIVNRWVKNGVKCHNALESQAMIEMYNNFCLKKKCLSCKIGVGLIRNT